MRADTKIRVLLSWFSDWIVSISGYSDQEDSDSCAIHERLKENKE